MVGGQAASTRPNRALVVALVPNLTSFRVDLCLALTDPLRKDTETEADAASLGPLLKRKTAKIYRLVKIVAPTLTQNPFPTPQTPTAITMTCLRMHTETGRGSGRSDSRVSNKAILLPIGKKLLGNFALVTWWSAATSDQSTLRNIPNRQKMSSFN